MSESIEKTGRKFKFTGKWSKENNNKTLYLDYFEEGKIYDEATDLITDMIDSLFSGLLEKLNSKPIKLLTKDIENGDDIILVVNNEDVELVECDVNCDCFEHKISSEEEHEKARKNQDGYVKIEIIDSNNELSVSIKGEIDKKLLRRALYSILNKL